MKERKCARCLILQEQTPELFLFIKGKRANGTEDTFLCVICARILIREYVNRADREFLYKVVVGVNDSMMHWPNLMELYETLNVSQEKEETW